MTKKLINNITNLISTDTTLKEAWSTFLLQHYNNFQQKNHKLKIKDHPLSNVANVEKLSQMLKLSTNMLSLKSMTLTKFYKQDLKKLSNKDLKFIQRMKKDVYSVSSNSILWNLLYNI